MAKSDFLAFATAPAANVATQDQWIADPVVPEGFTSGILPSAKTNKAIRQATFVAAGVAEMMRQALGQDVLDDGNLGFFAARLSSAISALGGGAGSAGAVPEAPNDGQLYGRGSIAWLPTLHKGGDTMHGLLTLYEDPIGAMDACTKQYADAISNIAGNAVQRGGDTMTGLLVLSADPAAALGAATRQYADTKLALAGGTMTGLLVLSGDPTAARGAATRQYVDALRSFDAATYVPLAGGTMTGPLILAADPAAALGAATRQYVDAVRTFAAATYAPLISPALTGIPTGPTAAPGTNTTQLATTAFVATAVAPLATTAGVAATYLALAGGTISGSAPGALTINRGATLPAAPALATPVLWGLGNTNETPSVVLDAYGVYPVVIFRAARGTAASPTPIVAGDVLGHTAARGYAATSGWSGGAGVARVQFIALENFTATGQGTQINFQTNPPGTTSLTTQVNIGVGLTVGAPVAPAGGMLSGDLSAVRLFASGSTAGLTVNRNSAALIASGLTTPLSLTGADTESPALFAEAFAGAPQLVMRRANGTGAIPAHVNNNDIVGQLNWRGYAGSGYSGNIARIVCWALQDFTDAVQGTQLSFHITPVGSAGPVVQATLGPGLAVGAAAYPAGGILLGDVVAQRAIVNQNTALAPLGSGNPIIGQFHGADGVNPDVILDAHNGNGTVRLRHTNGTGALPTATLSGNFIGQFAFNGYGATGYLTQPSVRFRMVAVDNFTDAIGGARLDIGTTPTGSFGITTVLSLLAGAQIGAPTGGDKGAGTLNATGVYAGGVALTSDIRLKRDINRLPDDCLSLVGAIEPKSFRFIEPPLLPPDEEDLSPTPAGPPGWFDRPRWGFIAQDVEGAMRQAGHDFGGIEAGDDGLRSLSYFDLLAVLWKAVQELHSRVVDGP
jgi:hypothetical protein